MASRPFEGRCWQPRRQKMASTNYFGEGCCFGGKAAADGQRLLMAAEEAEDGLTAVPFEGRC